MRHWQLVCALGVWLCGNVLWAQNTAEWKFRQEIRVERPGLIKVELPEGTLDAARAGLEDLRVFDASGAEVPYLIERVQPEAARTLRAKKFDVQLEKDSTVVTAESGLGHPVDAIQLETSAANFIKAVRVEASADGKSWTLLLTGAPFFRSGGEERLQAGMTPGAWNYIRITIDDSKSGPIPVTGVLVHPAPQPAPETPLGASLKGRKEDAGATRLVVDLGSRNLTLSSIRIATGEPLFTRNVDVRVRRILDHVVQEQTVASGTISRVVVEGQPSIERLEFPVEAQIPSRDVLLLIENQGSPPIAVDSVQVMRRPVYLMFPAKQAASYFLYSGNRRGTAPAYDLSYLSTQLNKTPVTKIAFGAVTPNPAYHPAEPFPELAKSATPLDVSAWSFRKKVEGEAGAVQEMELDLQILSHARNDFGDLRLMQQGKQFPYLLERASSTHELQPAVSSEQDKRNPHVSRWILKLPYASIPVSMLSCKASTALFRRSVRLYETARDERGSARERFLGQADWVQSAEDRERLFLLSLTASPQTDTLILETDNGENPALQLRQFTLYYPVSRLLFKPPSGSEVYVYYGNEKAVYPQYDIELAAQQLLDSEKSEVKPGAEELLKAPRISEAAARNAGVLFWMVLAVVVLVLLYIVSRLLPKT